MKFAGSHILSVDQFERADLEHVLEIAAKMEHAIETDDMKILQLMKGKILATIFYEPSTRTRLSFESAMTRLGGKVISNPDMFEFSSVSKGETYFDTAQMISCYADIIAMRHPEAFSVEKFSKGAKIPVLNAGDGAHEHPTQALLDLYTISKDFESLDGISIAMIGDLKYGRTVHSLTKLLLHFKNIRFTFVSPEALQMPEYILDILKSQGIEYTQTESLEEGIVNQDVLYVTRIQKERFESEEEYLKYKGVYVIEPEVMKGAKDSAIVLHPLPRVGEIAIEFDEDPRAKYFEQAQNGVYVRMALLALCLDRIPQ